LAVRLGNPGVVQHVLSAAKTRKKSDDKQLENAYKSTDEAEGMIEINARCGFNMNTGFHLAAARSNYEMVMLLDRSGADIFVRNRENKTSS